MNNIGDGAGDLSPEMIKQMERSFKAAEGLAPALSLLRDNFPPKEYYKQLNVMIDKSQVEMKFNDHIQCGKQECSFCCHDKIMGSHSEMVNIIEIVKEKNIPINKSVIQTNDNWDKLNFAQRACPLLVNGKCSIYEDRPMVCRKHNIALGQSPEICKEGGEVGTIIMEGNDSLAMADIMLDSKIVVLNFMLMKV